MGTVERAVDTATGRTVALKRLILANAEDAKKQRVTALFEREYHVLSQLAHPGIVEVYDYGVDDIGPYYTMEMLDGDDVARRAPLEWRQACSVIRDVASSLAIIHARGFVHRDVTPMNVRCTTNGRAKLLDFGAMCAMGVPESLVGTPPFVPPEAVQRRPLDGRADLFALGASLYFLLTGKHAYPARTFEQLHQLWQIPVPSPEMLCDDVPVPLSNLIMELISPDLVARPTNAAQVFERLTGIAGLARGEQHSVTKAYLDTPSLVGRQQILTRCDGRLLKAMSGQGSSIVFRGEAGSGRSRLMEASALAAQLRGATVLNADAAVAHVGDFGLLRRLATQLLQTHAQTQELIDDPLLSGFVESIRQRASAPPRPASEAPAAVKQAIDRPALLSAFVAWLCKVSEHFALLVAIDDLQSLDEPSLALLASLASRVGPSRILMLSTLERDAETRSEVAVSMLTELSTVMEVEPLSQEDTHAMLGSVFDEVANLSVLTAVLYRVCAGNPGSMMQRSQDLIDAGVIHYEGGLWIIPNQPADLERIVLRPDGVVDRLKALSDDARELAYLIALDRDGRVRPADLVPLSQHGDGERVQIAMEALVRANVVIVLGDGYSLTRPNYAAEIVSVIDKGHARQLHARLANWLVSKPQYGLSRLHHQALAGDISAVYEAKTFLLAPSPQNLVDMRSARYYVDTLEELLVLSVEAGAAPSTSAVLRTAVVGGASLQGAWERTCPHIETVLTDLALYSGLTDYHSMSDVPESERLTRALAVAQARHDALPVQDRGFSAEAAIHQLARAVLAVGSASWSMLDNSLSERIPSLAPFVPLSPVLGIIERARTAQYDIMHGSLMGCWQTFRELYAELTAAGDGIPEDVRVDLWIVITSFLQGIEASMGVPAVLERVKEMEAHVPRLAESERYGYYLAMGDVQRASAARKRMELLNIQDGARRHDPTHWNAELNTNATFRDVVGLKQCLTEATRMERTRPHWGVRRRLAQAIYDLMCGSQDTARAQFETLFKEVPQQHPERLTVVSYWMTTLQNSGQYALAKQIGEAYIADHPRAYVWGMMMAVASAESQLGDHDSAAKRMVTVIDAMRAWDCHGVSLGIAYETAAYIALRADNPAGFETYAALCGEQFKAGRNPGLTARYQVLMQAARKREISVRTELEKAAQYTIHAATNDVLQKLQTAMGTSMELADRYQTVLHMMVQTSSAAGGFLYATAEDGLRLVASEGPLGAPGELAADVTRYWTIEVARITSKDEPLDMVTATEEADEAPKQPIPQDIATKHFASGQRVLLPFLLVESQADAARPCGMVLLAPKDESALEVPRTMLEAFAKVLSAAAAGSNHAASPLAS